MEASEKRNTRETQQEETCEYEGDAHFSAYQSVDQSFLGSGEGYVINEPEVVPSQPSLNPGATEFVLEQSEKNAVDVEVCI